MKGEKFLKGQHVIYDNRMMAKVVEGQTENGNARIAYYDTYSGETVRMWVDVKSIRKLS